MSKKPKPVVSNRKPSNPTTTEKLVKTAVVNPNANVKLKMQ